MQKFVYYAPTEIVFGKDAELKTAELVKKHGGSRVLVIYGGKSAVKSGLIDRVMKALEEGGIEAKATGGVVPNPLVSTARRMTGEAREFGADFILAVGGGSVIDTAKGVAHAAGKPGTDVWDFWIGKEKPTSSLPIGAVLTISAAGSETSNSAVLTLDDQKPFTKRGLNCDANRCRFAIMNPELTMTLPDYQTCAGCSDILMHTMERYFTNGSKLEITDALAEGLLRTVMQFAAVLHKDPLNYQARAEIMWAGSLSHNGLTGCGNDGNDFASHRLEHELGALYGVTHGAGLTAVWPSWARYVYKNCLPRFVKFAVNVMGVAPGVSDEETALQTMVSSGRLATVGHLARLRELTPAEAWPARRGDILAGLDTGNPWRCRILAEEGMVAELMDDIEARPNTTDLDEYRDLLFAHDPDRTLGIWHDLLMREARQMQSNRRDYERFGKSVAHAAKLPGGPALRDRVVSEVVALYPRRPALREVLARV